MKTITILVSQLALTLILVVATQMAQKKMTESKEKWNQFECGFNLMTPQHLPLSFQFFLVALLFLIFDVEISLILSYPLEPSNSKNMILLFLFVSILTIGLIYEWQKSKIDWSKWMGENSLQEL